MSSSIHTRNRCGTDLPDSPTHEQLMLNAVNVFCARVSGQPVRRITITLADQSRRSFTVPNPPRLALADEHGDTLKVWPKPNGWDFRPGEASWNGVVFSIAGKPAAVLKVLAEAGGPVDDATIIEKVWGDDVEPHSLQAAVSSLRTALKRTCGVAGDPVNRVDGGYRLCI
jgi:DNA-binding response OmpR family regulator